MVDVDFRKGELEGFMERSYRSRLTQDDVDSFAKVALDYELSRGFHKGQEGGMEGTHYNRFNIKVEMVYHPKIDKMARKNWATFKALETACGRVRVESLTLEF